jgi:hypothetical protein
MAFPHLDAIAELLVLSSKYSAAGPLAADHGDLTAVVVRIRQTICTTREAALIAPTPGQPEAGE